jgi:single-strand DNA-binding protein
MNGAEATFIGNMTKDPELRYGQSGKAWLTGSIAVNKRITVNGEAKETTVFINWKCFGDLAENMAGTFRKGMRAIVSGTFETDEYTDKEGVKRSSLVLVLSEAGPSVRWATADVTRTAGNGAGAPRPAMASVPAGEPEFDGGANPFYTDSSPF